MDEPIVTIKQGQLKGCIQNDIDGGRIFSFLGVPYAKPPLGELRFKAPLPAEPWSGVKDATKEGNNCYSRDLQFFKGLEGSEDCLNLNVFTRSLPNANSSLKPVMVWIHGGAFITGSNKTCMYGPDFLLTEDIVLVSINYRLGALGFLSAEDVSLGVPGNAGLKDQTLALKWVQENIRKFNGDPNNVTIFGESAGGGSVHYQILSLTARGLFHKAILQSGTSLNYWAYGQPSVLDLAKELDQDVNDERQALDILKNIPVESLYAAQEKLDSKRQSGRPYFAPVVEKPNDTAFITEKPIDIISSGKYNKVPLMIGYTTREGLLMAVIKAIAERSGAPMKKEQPNLEDFIPWQLGLEKGSESSKKVVQKMTEVYFKSPDTADNTYVLATDSLFLAGIMATVKNHLETSQDPIFLYRMSLDAELNVVKKFIKLSAPGACHGDDVGYLFKNMTTPPLKPGSIEEVSVRRFVKLWTNFAKYGNPTPENNELGVTWKPVERGNIHFLDIGNDLTTGVNPESERIKLWRELYQLNSDTAKFL